MSGHGRVIGIVGRQGSGKTTLIERLIPAIQGRGLSVSTVKHTHHHGVELDVPGKDSHRHRLAGASEVIVASDNGWARIAARHGPATLPELLAQLRPVDVVLVEGFKHLEDLRRIEVHRDETAPLALSDPGIDAVATPGGVIPGHVYRGVTLALEDTQALLEFLLSD